MDPANITPVDKTAYFNAMEFMGPLCISTIKVQKEALSIQHKTGGLTFAKDIKGGGEGSKSFLVAGLRSFFHDTYKKQLTDFEEAIESKRNGRMNARITQGLETCCYYEVVDTEANDPGRATPCNLAFDIEFKPHLNPTGPSFDERMAMFLAVVELMFERIARVPGISSRWHIVQLDSSNAEKISRHLVIHLPDNMMFYNWFHVGAFVRRVILLCMKLYGHPTENPLFIVEKPNAKSPVPFIDRVVYTSLRNFRIIGSTKLKDALEKPRPLLMMKGEASEVYRLSEITYEMFMSTIIQYAYKKDITQLVLLKCREYFGGEARTDRKIAGEQSGVFTVDIGRISDDGMYDDIATKNRMFAGIALNRVTDPNQLYFDAGDIDWSNLKDKLSLVTAYLSQQIRAFYPELVIKTPMIDNKLEWSFRTYKQRCPIKGDKHTSNNQSYHIRLGFFDKTSSTWRLVHNPKLRVWCFDDECENAVKSMDGGSAAGLILDLPPFDENFRNLMVNLVEDRQKQDMVLVSGILGPVLKSSDDERR
ncbi:MAG: hypothetical protein JSS82_14010 [Bacteroidetes bacterium]|nr:hypothetical protein [Bacteroidota bacterium]